jgi:NAD(P)-dependent dehydrogenase (short-subunit alcohol dehydrogenase family)
MAPSPLHMLAFSLCNPYTLSLDPDSPFRVLYRALRAHSPTIRNLDLSAHAGQTILITGATSGCGLETSLALGCMGCQLILTSRTRDRGELVKQQILEEAKVAGVITTVDIVLLDLRDLQSIRCIRKLVEQKVSHLDVVILNAGVYTTSFQICPESGWEETIQVNALATAALSLHLRPLLAQSKNAKLLIVSSEAHAWAHPQHHSTKSLLENIGRSDSKTYPCYQRYHISKLLSVLWAKEICSRDEWRGIRVAAVSPGYTRSGLFRTFNDTIPARTIERVACRLPAEGASQYIFALQNLDSNWYNGHFWSDGHWRK